jgi:hypothetical protein
LNYILDQKGASLVIMSHLGRPKKPDKENSLAPVAQRLSELLAKKVTLAPDCIGPEAEAAVKVAQEKLKQQELAAAAAKQAAAGAKERAAEPAAHPGPAPSPILDQRRNHRVPSLHGFAGARGGGSQSCTRFVIGGIVVTYQPMSSASCSVSPPKACPGPAGIGGHMCLPSLSMPVSNACCTSAALQPWIPVVSGVMLAEYTLSGNGNPTSKSRPPANTFVRSIGTAACAGRVWQSMHTPAMPAR